MSRSELKEVFLGMGTNLYDREKNLQDALCHIRSQIGELTRISSVYETEPWGFSDGNRFLNMAVLVKTRFTPAVVLKRVLSIETMLGRTRGTRHGYSSRIIDIDILLYENRIISRPELKIPHPLLHKRNFVLVPLVEICPEGVHPVLDKTFAILLEECRDDGIISQYGTFQHPLCISPMGGKEIQ
ncbi:MAG: 2-amino-4-hydroxy-6-hydroxymethyldihydropteridine diphosphokinase [Bacteroidales bacterium]|jgi:2-amino-4-hydroxy-6-hydroxymethyldihydropteridine diphosphokinase|nr:2-amino-4-hydroxy-6-hydroxymethyldihydropteridine diphosphokinase [Bacteroidales bacterium]